MLSARGGYWGLVLGVGSHMSEPECLVTFFRFKSLRRAALCAFPHSLGRIAGYSWSRVWSGFGGGLPYL